jgi:hypothetical protein
MGYIATYTTPEGRRVLPLCIEGRNIIDSKTYPRKGWGFPLTLASLGMEKREGSAEVLGAQEIPKGSRRSGGSQAPLFFSIHPAGVVKGEVRIPLKVPFGEEGNPFLIL